MPPKQKYTKEDIVEAAFNVVREQGWEALSQRSIAKKLNASIGPIYSYFKSMANLEEAVIEKAYELLLQYMLTHAKMTAFPIRVKGTFFLLKMKRDCSNVFLMKSTLKPIRNIATTYGKPFAKLRKSIQVTQKCLIARRKGCISTM